VEATRLAMSTFSDYRAYHEVAERADEVRKDVLDALEKPMPRGYEEYLKRYYERLSEN